ncbi:MAG: hypothetical protein JWP58_4442 [Hymenobacter sp.]|nr:hypothetical protein [Hymenobacter sp.]
MRAVCPRQKPQARIAIFHFPPIFLMRLFTRPLRALLPFLALASLPGRAQTPSALIRISVQGRLQYVPDSRGNTVPDFSAVGYRSGDVAIPTVPVAVTLAPVAGDNRARIQAAIAQVSALPLNASGFRGAVLLTAGTYAVSGPLVVSASGVVLRGQGAGTAGTKLVATLRQQHTLVAFTGAGRASAQSSTGKLITNAYLPIGARTCTVASGHTFAVGDLVVLRRTPNQAWINLLGMDTLYAEDSTCVDWTPGSYTIDFKRKVTAVSGNTITLDAPVVDPIDPTYATGTLLKYTWTGKIENVGIESLRLDSEYSSPTDEQHGWDGVDFENAQNGWVRDVEVYHFGFAAVRVLTSSAFISVLNSKCFDAIALTMGERKYSFCIEGQRNLVMDCFTRLGRHDFMTGARVAGPNAFVRCTATQQLNIAGPHGRWATGTLYDNLVGDGPLNLENRRTSGTGHGWAGAQNMLWNCTAATATVQSPPGHINWSVGTRAIVSGVGIFFTGQGYVESTGTFVAPQSLYDRQLCERLGGAACATATANRAAGPEEQVIVYPNPHSRNVTVYFPGTTGQLTLTDSMGRVVREQAGFAPGLLNLGKLAAGAYLLRVVTREGKVFTRKIIRQE